MRQRWIICFKAKQNSTKLSFGKFKLQLQISGKLSSNQRKTISPHKFAKSRVFRVRLFTKLITFTASFTTALKSGDSFFTY